LRIESLAGSGHGFTFACYKNLEAWCAVAAEAAVERETCCIKQMAAAIDPGQLINPDGVGNQVEGVSAEMDSL
jgi:nicotinate dehydrogenase subunit B